MQPDVVQAWLGDGQDGAAPSARWLKVSVFLAGFSGLYFTVYAVTDETYRQQFFTSVTRELERAVAVRAVYRTLLALSLQPGTPPRGSTEGRRRGEYARSGVEVLLDQGGDRVDRGLVVAGDLDRVAARRRRAS